MLARQGAKVVVNDLGGSMDGAGGGSPVYHRWGDAQRLQPGLQPRQMQRPLIRHAVGKADGLKHAIAKAKAAIAHREEGFLCWQ